MKKSQSEQLLFCTTRLVGNNTAGTGFFFSYNGCVFLITNKHVIKDMSTGSFSLLQSNNNTVDNVPVFGAKEDFHFLNSEFIGHPNPNIDVTVMNISQKMNDYYTSGKSLYLHHVSKDLMPTPLDYETIISPIENIIFVGYPDGLHDTNNNLPIVRRGITASPCFYDFKGKNSRNEDIGGEKTFLVDASVFPGSSGSPVFIYYPWIYPDQNGNLNIGSKLFFLGIIARRTFGNESRKILGIDIYQEIDLGVVYKSDTIIETMDNYLKVANATAQPTAVTA